MERLRDWLVLTFTSSATEASVINNDSIVNRVTENCKYYSHKVCVDLIAHNNECTKNENQVVEKSDNRTHACGPAAYLFESQSNINDYQCSGKNRSNCTF